MIAYDDLRVGSTYLVVANSNAFQKTMTLTSNNGGVLQLSDGATHQFITKYNVLDGFIMFYKI